jgi:hypothetical protein
MSKFISIVINVDTRAGFQDIESSATEMFSGCRSLDFLIAGVQNKINFFNGFDKEIILFVDQHNEIPEDVLNQIRGMVDTLVIRKHSKRFGDLEYCHKFNDMNYHSALQLARGQYIAHFDSDCATFTRTPESVNKLIDRLEKYDYVSYPSAWSPRAVNDPAYNYDWCSTRFFMCKRETLDFTEIQKCLLSDEYLYGKYPASKHDSWFEHIIGLHAKYNGKGVYYPPIELNDYAIFCWNKYFVGVLPKLNSMNYDEVKNYIDSCSGIVYPADLQARQI